MTYICFIYMYIYVFDHLFIWIFRFFGHVTMGSFVGIGNQYTLFFTVLYCNLPIIGKQLSHMRSRVGTASLSGGR